MERPQMTEEMTGVTRRTSRITIHEQYVPAHRDDAGAATSITTITRAYSTTATGDLEAPDTECWNQYLLQPHKHILLCNHEYETETPEPCGPKCKTSKVAETKAGGNGFKCYQGWCGKERRRYENVSIFINKKKPIKKPPSYSTRELTPATKRKAEDSTSELFVGEGGIQPTPNKRSLRLPSQRKMTAKALSNEMTAKALSKVTTTKKNRSALDIEEDEIIRLNRLCELDPALAALIANSDFSGMRPKSKLHPGYALRAERDADDRAASLHKGMAKLVGVGGRRRAVDDPNFSMPDFPVGEMPDHAQVDAAAYEPTIHRTLKHKQALKRIREIDETAGDGYDSEDDLDGPPAYVGVRGVCADGTFFEAEAYCAVCEAQSTEDLRMCWSCDMSFHPSCLGVESFDRCNDCTERRRANEALAQRKFAKRTIAEVRAANLKRRNDAKAEAEKAAAKARKNQEEGGMDMN